MAGDPESTRIWIGNFLLEGISRGDTEQLPDCDRRQTHFSAFRSSAERPDSIRVLSERREAFFQRIVRICQSQCHWVVPGALRKADRELDYTAPISEASDSGGSLMAVIRK